MPPSRRWAWVLGLPASGDRAPGLVLSWRRRATGRWEALVLYVVDDQAELHEASTVQAWVDQGNLAAWGTPDPAARRPQ